MTRDLGVSRQHRQRPVAPDERRFGSATDGGAHGLMGALDPDVPSEAVGSWPTIDLKRLGLDRIELSPLGWVFVIAAIAVGLLRSPRLVGVSGDFLPAGMARWAAEVVGAALPAALLWRVPDAQRTRTILLAGLAFGTLAALIEAVVIFWPGGLDGSGWRGTALDGLDALLVPLGSLLVGIGLIGLLRRWPRRFGLLAAIAAIYLGIPLGTLWIEMAYSASVFDFGPIDILRIVVVPLASAFAVWVPVSAWLDRVPERGFWSYLALALPFQLVAVVFGIPESIVSVIGRSNALFPAAVALNAGVDLIVALLALYAYGRLMPRSREAPAHSTAPDRWADDRTHG